MKQFTFRFQMVNAIKAELLLSKMMFNFFMLNLNLRCITCFTKQHVISRNCCENFKWEVRLPFSFQKRGPMCVYLLLSSPRSKIFGSEFAIRRLNQINMEN